MGIKRLAEAVIAQAMDDLSDDAERNDSIRFFKGEGFRICAETADMDLSGQIMLLNMANKMVCETRRRKASNADVRQMRRKSGKYLHAAHNKGWGGAVTVK